MGTVFSELLVKLRKEAGFPTSYRFYHDSGGASMLKISYRKYLLLEQGRSLPSADKLLAFIWALKINHRSAEANALVAAWLKTLMGEDNYRDLVEPMVSSRAPGAGLSPMQKALDKSLAGRKFQITPKQTEAIYSSKETYLCYLALSNDTGEWGKAELAKSLGLSEAAAGKALKALAAVKMVKPAKKGRYVCPAAGKVREFLHLQLLPKEVGARMNSYDRELEAGGVRVFSTRSLLRVDALEFDNYYSLLEAGVDGAEPYAVTEKTPHSALFLVEGRATRLKKF